MAADKAIVEVAKEVEAKYYHDTVYCKSLSEITRQIRKMCREGQD